MSKKLSVKKSKKPQSRKKKSTKKTLKGYKQGVVRAMYYDVWIGGIKLGLDRKECITQISISETVSGSDSCTLQVSDPDLKFISDNIYQENKKVKVSMGWYGYKYRVTFNGYICAIDINFDSDGIPKMTIVCMDNTYRMNKKKTTKTFKKKTSAQIVKSIVKKYGFKCVVQSGYKFTKQDSIQQSDQTDIEFITSLANGETHPFTACLVGKTFYYVKMGKLDKKADKSLTYRDYPSDIISFSPQINTETIEVRSGSTNTKKKKSNTSKGSGGVNDNPDSSKQDKGKTRSTSRSSSSSKGKTVNYNPATRKWK